MPGANGEVWQTDDPGTVARMNQKTLLVDTGANISAATTYAGMLAYCTSSGSGFTVDFLYQRNAANTAWVIAAGSQKPYLELSTTIGDYSQPTSATSTSTGTDTSANVDLDFTEFADQPAFDAKFVSGDTTKMRGNPSNDNIDVNFVRDGSTDNIYFDLQDATYGLNGSNLSNSAFVVRMKIVISSVNSNATNVLGIFGFSSVSGGSLDATSRDFLGIRIDSNTGGQLTRVLDCDGVTGSSGNLSASFYTWQTATVYAEFTRLSTTSFKVQFFSDSGFQTSVGTATSTIASTIQDLRYFFVANDASGSVAGNSAITIDDFKVFNGVNDVADYPASNAVDNSTSTRAQTNSEANPAIYVDLGSNREIVGFALNLDRTNTTVTTLKVRSSTDTTFTDAENIAYFNVSDCTDDTWRFFAVNFVSENRRYVQFYANETGVLAINEIKVRYGVSDLVKILTHKHQTRNTSAVDSFVDSN